MKCFFNVNHFLESILTTYNKKNLKSNNKLNINKTDKLQEL